MAQETVIIIGGGIAGLRAAQLLSKDHHVILLEATNRLGGRIYNYRGDGFANTIEGGAEFMHGETKHTVRLLKEAGITYVALEGKLYRKERGGWQEQDEMVEHWDKLLRQMKKVKEDMTMYDFLQQYFDGEDYTLFRQHVAAYTEGFDVADVKNVSVKALYEEWSNEGEQYRVNGGYGPLVNYLANDCKKNGCEIVTNSFVKQVDWAAGNVTVHTNDGKTYAAEKCVVTVPISILQNGSIRFSPGLDNYIEAAQHIGFGAVIKVVLQFREAFWESDTGFILSKEQLPTWWTQFPDTIPMLTGWAGGPQALRLSGETDDVVLEKALQSLSAIFDIRVVRLKENLVAGKVFNWQHDNATLGGYSYATPESETARKLLNMPVADTLYFAGEALYDGAYPGTVEAAIASAESMVERLVK